MEESPRLSVVIASYFARATIGRCLASLEKQDTVDPFEVIVVESSGDGTVKDVRRDFPWVRVLAVEDRQYAGDARNLAIRQAHAGLIAFLDADCTVDSDWVSAVLVAHRSSHLVVGGVIDNARRDSLLSWGYYFCEFNLWLPGRGPREIDEIAGCCLSMKREAYDRYGPFLPGTYSSDTAFQWRLRADGHRVLRRPEIRVFHDGAMGFASFLGHILQHRKDFARVRSTEKGLSRFARLASAAASIALPPVLFSVIGARVVRSGSYVPQFIASMPVVVVGLAARCAGEFLGYLESARRSKRNAAP